MISALVRRKKLLQFGLLAGAISLLVGCATGSDKPKPAELAPNAALIGVRLAWSAKLGEVTFPLDVKVNGSQVALASNDGSVVVLDASSGRDLWRVNAGETLSAGVGSDGKTAAVVTRTNALVVFGEGRELWRQKMLAQVHTAPLVAGGRVFVLAADRSVSAFDGATGRKLWSQQRPGESALVLRQGGVILAVGDTLVVGLAGRMVGLNPVNGGIRWDVPLATSRGTNDVERLVDLVVPVSRNGSTVCARAFQSRVGCMDAAAGSLIWSQPANGNSGVNGDDRHLFGTESDGKVMAWNRTGGAPVWSSEVLKFRGVTAPVVAGRSVIVGDNAGIVHLLSRENGSPLNRLVTDGSAIAAVPVLAGDTLVAVTRNGGIFGFRPE
jgi:outer membrane assembly lipoprotein YfgL